MIKLRTKFEVPMLTHYKDMKCNAKCSVGVVLGVKGHLRSPVMSPFDRNYAPILYCFRAITNYISSRLFSPTPPAFVAPLGWIKYCPDL